MHKTHFVLIGPVYPFRGGIAHHTAALAQTMSDSGHKRTVISFRRQFPRMLYPGLTDRDPSALPTKVAAEYLLDPINPLTWRAAARRIIALQPKLVVIQWWTTVWAIAYSYLAGTLARSGIRSVFIIHNVIPHEPQPWDQALARLALTRAMAFIVQSEGERRRLLSLLPNARLVYLPHPLYDRFLRGEISSKERARAQIGISAANNVMLFFGIVRPYKGLHDLLQAQAILLREGIEITLLIAGEFWDSIEAYCELINQLGLGDWVRIDNRYIPDEEVPAYFRASDIFVAPYVTGTQSGAVAIARAFKLPIVLSEAIFDSANLEDNDTPIIPAPAGDPAGLARTIKAAIQLELRPSREDGSSTEYRGETPAGWQAMVDSLRQMARPGKS